jgi:hypothetical protein
MQTSPDNASLEALLAQALKHHRDGHPTEAQKLLETAQKTFLEQDPGDVGALHQAGLVALQTGAFDLAVRLMGQALSLAPNNPQLHTNIGPALQAMGRLEDALRHYEAALALNREIPETYLNYGNALIESETPEKAIDYYDQAIQLSPQSLPARLNKAACLRSLRRLNDALSSIDEALELFPGRGSLHFERGRILMELEEFSQAISEFMAVTDLEPNKAEPYYHIGTLLIKLNLFEDSLDYLDEAISLKPDYLEAYFNKASALAILNRLDESIIYSDKLLEMIPSDPQAMLCKSLVLLKKGEYEPGWLLYESRWRFPGHHNIELPKDRPLWKGEESLSGKSILLLPEQGLGDIIQFCRYTKMISDQGARVVLCAPKQLLQLFKRLAGVDELIEFPGTYPSTDFYCPLLTLPLAFKTRLDNIPFRDSYLSADPGKADFWRLKMTGKRLKVGLVWNGGLRPDRPDLWMLNERRNISLKIISDSLSAVDADFYSLQKGEPAESEIKGREAALWPNGNFFNFSSELKDFSDTAALIANLDLVICVDTSTAHLAAALGKPTWILNRFDACWRWLTGRTDSPWYASVKLYFQAEDREWEPVLANVRQDLQQLLGAPR